MIKTLEAIDETVRNPKHPFRKTDNQPRKSLKNRYERRKIKAYLHLGDWLSEDAVWRQFLDRLKRKRHERIVAFSLVPENLPTFICVHLWFSPGLWAGSARFPTGAGRTNNL